MCDDPSPAGPGRRRPRALARRCGTRSRACALSAGCGAPGAVPALRLYRACPLDSRVQGRATAPPSLQSPGKDDPATVRPKATTRLEFSNELGPRPHGKSEFRFQVLPRLTLLVSPTPILAESRSATFPGSAFWHPDSASWWTSPLLGPREDLPLKQLRKKLHVQNKDVVIAMESSLRALGGGRPSAHALPAFL